MLGDEQRIIDKHALVEVLRICHTRKTKADQAKMFNAIIALENITNRVFDNYNTIEGWVVKKMRSKYANRIVAILSIIYQKDKMQYFSNKFAMMISRIDHEKFVNWVAIMYFQIVKELIRWFKCQKNMIKRTTKKEPRKVVCHYAIVLEILFQKWFPLNGIESQEKKKKVNQCQEDKRRRDNLKERFIRNNRLLNLTHISFKKEKQSKTRTTKRIVLMSQFDDDKEREDFVEEAKKTGGYYNERQY